MSDSPVVQAIERALKAAAVAVVSDETWESGHCFSCGANWHISWQGAPPVVTHSCPEEDSA